MSTTPVNESCLRWHHLSALTDSQGILELLASASVDGIGVMARWRRNDSGGYDVAAMDTESEKWKDITKFGEDECVPPTPPEHYARTLELELQAANEKLEKWGASGEELKTFVEKRKSEAAWNNRIRALNECNVALELLTQLQQP